MIEKPSDEFMDAFGTSGGCSLTCQCGRLHFDYHNHYDWQDGELERLQQNAVEKPDEYFGHNYGVEGFEIDGIFFVKDCPCNQAVKYERWIIQHQEQLSKYLNARSDQLCAEAQAIRVTGVLGGQRFEDHLAELPRK